MKSGAVPSPDSWKIANGATTASMSPLSSVRVFALRLTLPPMNRWGCVIPRDYVDQFLFRKPLEALDEAEDWAEKTKQSRDTFRTRRRQRYQMRPAQISTGVYCLLQQYIRKIACE